MLTELGIWFSNLSQCKEECKLCEFAKRLATLFASQACLNINIDLYVLFQVFALSLQPWHALCITSEVSSPNLARLIINVAFLSSLGMDKALSLHTTLVVSNPTFLVTNKQFLWAEKTLRKQTINFWNSLSCMSALKEILGSNAPQMSIRFISRLAYILTEPNMPNLFHNIFEINTEVETYKQRQEYEFEGSNSGILKILIWQAIWVLESELQKDPTGCKC